MKATLTGYIANTKSLDEAALSTFNGYRLYRTAEEAREEGCEVWRVVYEFDAEVNADGYLTVNGEGYGPACDESSLDSEDWGYRAAVLEQLSDTVWHACQFVG
ncbi:MAG: hypothetical protein ACI4SS_03315 [Clostridia bacterium]